MHDTGHGIGPVESALRAVHKFDALGLLQGDDSKVEGAARIVNRHAVDDDLVVTRVTTTNKQRSQPSSLALSVDHGAGQESQGVSG